MNEFTVAVYFHETPINCQAMIVRTIIKVFVYAATIFFMEVIVIYTALYSSSI